MKVYIVLWHYMDHHKFSELCAPAVFSTVQGAIDFVLNFIEDKEEELDRCYEESWLEMGLPSPYLNYVVYSPHFAMWINEEELK